MADRDAPLARVTMTDDQARALLAAHGGDEITAIKAADAAATERAAQIAECHSDDRGGRARHFEWHDGYQDGCRRAATAIRNGATS